MLDRRGGPTPRRPVAERCWKASAKRVCWSDRFGGNQIRLPSSTRPGPTSYLLAGGEVFQEIVIIQRPGGFVHALANLFHVRARIWSAWTAGLRFVSRSLIMDGVQSANLSALPGPGSRPFQNVTNLSNPQQRTNSATRVQSNKIGTSTITCNTIPLDINASAGGASAWSNPLAPNLQPQSPEAGVMSPMESYAQRLGPQSDASRPDFSLS